MISWLHLTLIAAFAALILVLVFFQIFQQFLRPKTRRNIGILQNGIHQVSPQCDHERDSSAHDQPFFSWSDHPSLVVDAVQNGWPRFSFTTSMMSNVEISWEVCEGSADYMQKIRLKKTIQIMGPMGISVIRTALPLPGPRFGVSYFPQDAYFEIIILACNEDLTNNNSEHLTTRTSCNINKVSGSSLSSLDCNSENNLECLGNVGSERVDKVNEEGESESILVWIGLTGRGDVALKTHPGSFPGSIGFNSTGSLHLNGTKLVYESENEKWLIRGETVIGCGYNPSQKKVIFTVNSKLVHEIHCKTEEFGHPLYPTIAANTHLMFLLNLGQIPFKFEPGNLQRTPNPCFIGPHLDDSAAAIGYVDSMELFSMGRIDPKWRQWSGNSNSNSNSNTSNSIRALELDQESESDLIEICLA